MATVATPRRRPAPVPSRTRPASDRLSIYIPTSACTLDGFRDWVKSDDFPEKVHAAFIDQEIYLDMSQEELETHAGVKADVCRVLMNINHDLDLGRFFLDGILITNKAAGVSNNPDGVLALWESLDAGRVSLVPREGKQGQYLEIEGTPDWLMEIVSDSSVQKDVYKLREAYHRARVPEYWLIDARGEEVIFQILHWRKKGYVAAPNRGGWQQSRVFGRRFRLIRKRGRRGLWQYTLEVQPA